MALVMVAMIGKGVTSGVATSTEVSAFAVVFALVVGWDSVESMAARLAAMDWMVNLQLDGRNSPEHEEVLKRLPCKRLIDYNGKFLEPARRAMTMSTC